MVVSAIIIRHPLKHMQVVDAIGTVCGGSATHFINRNIAQRNLMGSLATSRSLSQRNLFELNY